MTNPDTVPIQTPEAAHDDALADMLAWLAGPVPSDAEIELAGLRQLLKALHAHVEQAAQFQRILGLIARRALRLSDTIKPAFAQASLPLSRSNRVLSSGLSELLGELAADHERVLGPEFSTATTDRVNAVAAQGLRLALEQMVLGALSGMPLPHGFWLRAQSLAMALPQSSAQDMPSATESPGANFWKQILALATVQPETLSPTELQFLLGPLGEHADRVAINAVPTARDTDQIATTGYWIDPSQDSGPRALTRFPMPAATNRPSVRHIDFSALADKITEDLERSDQGASSALTPAMRRILQRWLTPATRQLHRRPNNFRTHLHSDLDCIWTMLSQFGTPANEQQPSEWLVVNESPGGFAAMHVAGSIPPLRPGMLVVLWLPLESTWGACVVRWLRSDNPEHMELGLELIGQRPQPVRLAFRSHQDMEPTRALMLPPVGSARPHPALITDRDACISRRMVVIIDHGSRVQIQQGRMRDMVTQTAYLDVFCFESDPYPI